MRTRIRLFVLVAGALVLLAVGIALGASGMALPFTHDAVAEGHWDYFAYTDKTEFDNVLSSVPSSCDVDFEIIAAGSEALFAAITNCGP